MPRFDVTTYGEGVLRLSVPAGQRIETAANFDVHVAGTEANVVGALSRLGWTCGWVSALPDTPPGRRVQHAYRAHGTDLSSVVWREGGRVSSVYVEYAHPPRPIKIYYDRKESCFTQMTAEDVDWDYLLDTRHLHLSGLTVPLSTDTAEIIELALTRAKENGITTSFDVNYRNLLWSTDEARDRLLPLLNGVDILFCGRRDAEAVFGCEGEPEDIIGQVVDLTSASNIVVSLGSEGVIGWDGAGIYREDAKRVWIVDRIGAGDAMVAGVLHGWMKGSLADGLQYGAVMAALALSQHGDTVVTHARELETLRSGDAADIVR